MLKNIHNGLQTALYHLALKTGCHQLPNRSFRVGRRQVPLCARCTGILVGLLLAPLFSLCEHLLLAEILLMVFAADVFSQLAGLRESTNLLRLGTGMGFSYTVVVFLFEVVRRWNL